MGMTMAAGSTILGFDHDEYVRLLYLASYGIDRNSSFRFTPSTERVRKGMYGHPAGRIEHK